MTLDEAIRHAEEVAEQQMQRIDNLSDIPRFGSSDEDIKLIEKCEECAEEHRQLAEWLRDYKRLLDVADSNVGKIDIADGDMVVSLNDRINDLISAIENDECQYWTVSKIVSALKKLPGASQNSDCISRQKVIDMLNDIDAEVNDGCGYMYEHWMDYIKQLPSVSQPKTAPDISSYYGLLSYVGREDGE